MPSNGTEGETDTHEHRSPRFSDVVEKAADKPHVQLTTLTAGYKSKETKPYGQLSMQKMCNPDSKPQIAKSSWMSEGFYAPVDEDRPSRKHQLPVQEVRHIGQDRPNPLTAWMSLRFNAPVDQAMSQLILSERFESRYRPAIEAFVNDIEGLEVSGIPEPHLPYWGPLYEVAPLRVGIIGRDTRGWGDMTEFIECVRSDSKAALQRHRDELDGLAFTGWTNNFGKTFWDTTFKILAAMHGVIDWKHLKKRQETTPLKSFFWANVNTIERFEVCPQGNGVPWETWRKVKDASEKHLDSFQGILEVFRPHVVFLMNWDPGDHFLDFEIQWQDFGDHQASAFYEPTRTHIFATAHPTWLNQNSIYDAAITGIIEEAKKTVLDNRLPPPVECLL